MSGLEPQLLLANSTIAKQSLAETIKTMNRTKIAASATFVWLAGNAVLFFLRGGLELDLNELGDFFAGVMAPLAFLWLIVGYFQQGDELKNNTEALKAQVKEYRDGVERQDRMLELV